jgi:hypothetical protein
MKFLSKPFSKGKSLTYFALFLLIASLIIPLYTIQPASAVAPNITLKWTGYVAGGGEALLTYDVRPDIPGEEVFHAGGAVQVPPYSNGSVTCLNGVDGNQIWKRSIRGIGDTATMQMADLDLDGKMEIMVALQMPSGLYVLNAEDGSILWNAPGVNGGYAGYFTRSAISSTILGGRIDGSGVVADTDRDGTPDIFIGVMGYEKDPTTGAIIHLEWNGSTFVERGRTQVWHPCAGGLSMGDTDNDGTPELYMNERDAYFGDGSWGRGTTCFDVWNGTNDVFDVRWRVYDWGASSDIPMLIDVNKDGVQEAVTTNLGRGIMVLNSTTGQPIQNAEGTTLKSTSLAMHAHYQSSIYDIDLDGNPELLCADGKESQSFGTQVFDLWSWKLDADIPAGYSFRGPSIGEVTGDGIKDILVVTFDLAGNTNTGTFQVYDNNYQKVFEYGGLRHRAIGSIVQDVDDEGLNEILVLTQGGVIYCFDTPGVSEESLGRPRARSEVHFYSESRLGASEYVPFERSVADIKAPNPVNGESGVPTTKSALSFNLNHPNNELMSYAVTTDFGITSASANNVGNGVKNITINGLLASNTLYHWQVRVTDATGDVTVKDYTFTTGPYTANRAPTQTTPSLTGSTKVEDLVATAQGTSDLDGNAVINIYNWQRGTTSIVNINLPFETQTDHQDEFSGLATTKDYAYGAIGAVFGATWVPSGKVGGAYSFGGNDFIRFTESGSRYDGNGAWNAVSVESWVQPSAASTTGRLVMKNNLYDSNSSYSLDCARTATGLAFTWRIGVPGNIDVNMSRYVLGPVSVTTDVNAWHHVVATYKSSIGLRLYVDGVLVSSLLGPAYTGNIFNSNGPFEIAFSRSGAFQGLVDEVRLYPFEVTPAMVNQRYQDTKDGLSTSSTISKYDTLVGESWRCQVTPNDGLTDGITTNTASTTITAETVTAPSVSNLAISPVLPLTNDDLVATYTYNAGTSGYPEYSSTIRWYKNGVYNFTNAFLPASFTAKGDVWSFRITPSNGFASGVEVTSSSVTIGNTAPSISGGVILPDPALDTSTLTAAPSGWADTDGDTPGYTYQWQIKTGDVYTDISGATNQNLDTAYFAPNDLVAVKVTPFDGLDYGTALTFETQIIGDQPPVAGTPILTGTRDDDELTCTPGSTSDPDGDKVINVYNWLKGSSGTSVTNMYLPFETCSTTTASDYSGNSNHGSISGATWTPQGIVGGAYQFDGNDAINVADSATLGNGGTWTELTVEAWVYPATDQSRTVILNKNGGAGSANGKYMLGFMRASGTTTSNTVYFGIYSAASAYEDPTFSQTYDNIATKIPVGSWSHVVGTYEAGVGLNLYINGVLASHASVTGSIQPSVGEQLTIGYSSPIPGTANRYFVGSLDEVKIYPNALSAAQIFQNYAIAKDGANDAATIVPQETASGDVWRCSVTPNDGWQDGATVQSNQVTVTSANTKPHVDWYSPADSTVRADIGVPIDFKQVSTDADNSPLSYSWTLDSVQQKTTQNWTFTPQSIGLYTVRVTVSDGTTTDYQEWVVNANLIKPHLYVQVNGGGTTNATGNSYYDVGTAVQVLATPNSGGSFINWLLNGTNVGSLNPYQLTMDNNYYLTAVFTEAPHYTLMTTTVGSGSLTANPSAEMYDAGTIVQLTVTPAAGWSFSGWSGDLSSGTNPTSITMDSNKAVTATFTQNTYTLTVNVVGSGSVGKVPDLSTYTYGTSVDLTANAADGWVFKEWSDDVSGTTNHQTIVLNGNKTVTATFTLPPSAVLFSDGYESGDFSKWTGTTVTTGGTATVTANNVHSGLYSGQFSITAGTANTTRRAYSYINLDSLAEVYASAYVYIPSDLTLSNTQKLFAIQFNDAAGTALASYGVIADNTGMHWGVQYTTASSAVATTGPSGGGWYLLEAHFTHAASGPTLALSVNGVQVASLVYDTSSANPVASARFGSVFYNGSPAVTINTDDVAIKAREPAIVLQDKTSWYWTSNTNITATATGDVNNDGKTEIITVGYYNDGTRNNAQLVVWNQNGLSVQKVVSWYWTSDTLINSVAVGDVNGDGLNEIVTGGGYFDGTRWNAQLCVWNGETLALQAVKGWCWTSDTQIRSVTLANISKTTGLDIVTGGAYYDGTYWNAQLCVWSGVSLTLENVKGWLWGSGSIINYVAVGDIAGAGVNSIVTGGQYSDGTYWNAQLCVWDATTLNLNNIVGWLSTADTEINSIAIANLTSGKALSIIVGGDYNDGTRTNAQLTVWNGSTLTLQNAVTWFTTSNTRINSVAVGSYSNGAGMYIVTAGVFNDRSRDNAQLYDFNGATLATIASTSWFETGATAANSVAISDFGAGNRIVVGGSFFDNTRSNAQLSIWR